MSFDYYDAQQEEWYAQLYEENAAQAQAEFKAERLKSYYLANRDLAQPAVELLSEARRIDNSARATLVLSASAAEVGIKAVLLRPIVHGLVHSEPLANLVTDMVIAHQGVDRFRDLLIGILRDYGGVDLLTFRRKDSPKPLWEEIKDNQRVRNAVIHRGLVASDEEAELSIAVASTVLEKLFIDVMYALGLHIHDGYHICDDAHLAEEHQRTMERLLRTTGSEQMKGAFGREEA